MYRHQYRCPGAPGSQRHHVETRVPSSTHHRLGRSREAGMWEGRRCIPERVGIPHAHFAVLPSPQHIAAVRADTGLDEGGLAPE
jgi:hypothetical protein